jgi:hypothetical protein
MYIYVYTYVYIRIYMYTYIAYSADGTLLGAYGACVGYIHNIYKYTDIYLFFVHAF